MFFKKILRSIYIKIQELNSVQKVKLVKTPNLILGSTLVGNVRLNSYCKIYNSYISGNVTIGKYTSIWGPNTTISSHVNKIEIGNFCSIARNVSIQEANHRTNTITTYNILRNFFKEPVGSDMDSKGSIIIKNDVWVGANAVILGGVNVGNGVVIAAGSVVTKDIPDYAIVGGNPAKIIKYRFDDEIITLLKKLEWWNWPDNKITENKWLFEGKFDDVKVSKLKDMG